MRFGVFFILLSVLICTPFFRATPYPQLFSPWSRILQVTIKTVGQPESLRTAYYFLPDQELLLLMFCGKLLLRHGRFTPLIQTVLHEKCLFDGSEILIQKKIKKMSHTIAFVAVKSVRIVSLKYEGTLNCGKVAFIVSRSDQRAHSYELRSV